MTKKKKNASAAALCPCGSGLCLAECCGRYLTGGAEHLGAPTPEALMRSRYTAFALGDEAYLLDTWETAHRPDAIWARGEARVKWLSLKVLEASAPEGNTGRVRFVATGRTSAGAFKQSENSRFLRGADGRWRYVSGEVDEQS